MELFIRRLILNFEFKMFLIVLKLILSIGLTVNCYPQSSPSSSPTARCGIRQVNRRDSKIVGGTSTFHGQYPWAASIRIKYANNRHHCGGSLINDQWILTAAHCVASFSSPSFVVRLGGYLRSNVQEQGSIDVPVKYLVSHEEFTFSSFNNDIALLKLQDKVNFTEYIQPICLPHQEDGHHGHGINGHGNGQANESNELSPSNGSNGSSNEVTDQSNYYTNKTGVVIGWGRLTQSGGTPVTLQQVTLPILDNKLCMEWYGDQGKSIQLKSSQFCAGYEQGKYFVLTNLITI